MRTMTSSIMRIALVQCSPSADKAANVANALRLVDSATRNGAKLVLLPECFNSPFGTQYFDSYAESVPGPTTESLSACALRNDIHLVGGSIPERQGDLLYNTLTAFDNKGRLIGKHRKLHLFDIDVPGKMKFTESDVLTAGDTLSIIQVDDWKIGLGICYDIRFAGMTQAYRAEGCHAIIFPGAFNMTTGPMHWQLLARARATDNQMYVAMPAPARDDSASYTSWAHSIVADPWGAVVVEADEGETIVYADMDMACVQEVRKAIPISHQAKPQLYHL